MDMRYLVTMEELQARCCLSPSIPQVVFLPQSTLNTFLSTCGWDVTYLSWKAWCLQGYLQEHEKGLTKQSFLVGNGQRVLFTKDIWCGMILLEEKIPNLAMDAMDLN